MTSTATRTGADPMRARKPAIKRAAILLALGVLAPSSAYGSEILLADHGNPGTGVTFRLEGLGHTVTVSDASTWDANFDYSPFDVVGFEYSDSPQNPADIPHLVDAVDAGDVGVVFFRGYEAEATAAALGLITGGRLNWQTANPLNLNVVNNSHFITENLAIGAHELGYTYMTYIETPGVSTTILGNGANGAALLVHDTRRVVATPFYGHPAGFGNETPIGLEITDRSVRWAAIPEPATLMLLALGGLAVLRRR